MRKKMGCLLALMALLSALTACGGDSAEDVSGTLPPETPMTPEETEFQSGRVEGGTYTNEFLSVACQLGDEWTYLTDEEIAQLNGEIGESLTDEELSEMFSNGKTVQDMYAASADGTATINVIFEDMGVLYGAALDEDALMQAGMSDIQVEAGSMEFAGADHSTLRVTSTISEIPVYELMVCVKEGNYMGVITLASYLEDTTEEMAALFTALPQ